LAANSKINIAIIVNNMVISVFIFLFLSSNILII